MTFEEAISVIQGIFAWAKVVRRRYDDFECGTCGVTYHPRSGKSPPKEKKGAKYETCGHAHFREAFSEWDPETNDWRPW